MSTATAKSPTNPPLVALSDDEQLFRDNIRQCAEEKIRPLSR